MVTMTRYCLNKPWFKGCAGKTTLSLYTHKDMKGQEAHRLVSDTTLTIEWDEDGYFEIGPTDFPIGWYAEHIPPVEASRPPGTIRQRIAKFLTLGI